MATATDDKKYFDITPPPSPLSKPAVSAINRQMAADPAERDEFGGLAKHVEASSLSVTRETNEAIAPDLNESSNEPSDAPAQSHPAFTITEPTPETSETPPSPIDDTEKNEISAETELLGVNPLPETPAETVEQASVSAETEASIADTAPANTLGDSIGLDQDNSKEADDSMAPERYAATDALPDPIQKTTIDAQANMQDPKIFDTKEYIVPIGDTNHTHGHLKSSIIFGILFAAAVVGGGLLYVVKFVK